MDLSEVEKALNARLAGDSTLLALLGGTANIFNGYAEPGSTLPVVVFSFVAATEEDVPRAVRARYLVKGIATSLKSASALANRIDELLDNQTLTVAGMTNYYIRAESHIRYIEPDAGMMFGHAGADYTIWLEES